MIIIKGGAAKHALTLQEAALLTRLLQQILSDGGGTVKVVDLARELFLNLETFNHMVSDLCDRGIVSVNTHDGASAMDSDIAETVIYKIVGFNITIEAQQKHLPGMAEEGAEDAQDDGQGEAPPATKSEASSASEGAATTGSGSGSRDSSPPAQSAGSGNGASEEERERDKMTELAASH